MGSTARGAYPYPEATDPISQGDDVIHALADAVDTKLGVMAGGTISLTILSGQLSITGAVIFPAGRFTAAPYVVVGIETTFGSTIAAVSAITAAGCNIALSMSTGSAAGANTTRLIHWIAIAR